MAKSGKPAPRVLPVDRHEHRFRVSSAKLMEIFCGGQFPERIMAEWCNRDIREAHRSAHLSDHLTPEDMLIFQRSKFGWRRAQAKPRLLNPCRRYWKARRRFAGGLKLRNRVRHGQGQRVVEGRSRLSEDCFTARFECPTQHRE